MLNCTPRGAVRPCCWRMTIIGRRAIRYGFEVRSISAATASRSLASSASRSRRTGFEASRVEMCGKVRNAFRGVCVWWRIEFA